MPCLGLLAIDCGRIGRQVPAAFIARDIDDALRIQVLARLSELGADELALRPVREYHELQSVQQVQALGDSLPIGLRLLSDAVAGAATD